MLHLYTWSTPNGYKPLILLHEIERPFELHPVNLGEGEQKRPEFLKISPNGRIPAVVDEDVSGGPAQIFESGAILWHIADQAGRFLPTEKTARARTHAWLMFQVGHIGPMFGQLYHFLHADQASPYALERFRNEALHLYRVLDHRLSQAEFLAGEYSIADMATYPWAHRPDGFGFNLDDFAQVKRWVESIQERSAVKRAYHTRFADRA